jgi:hypothetical protein
VAEHPVSKYKALSSNAKTQKVLLEKGGRKGAEWNYHGRGEVAFLYFV